MVITTTKTALGPLFSGRIYNNLSVYSKISSHKDVGSVILAQIASKISYGDRFPLYVILFIITPGQATIPEFS